MAADFSLQWTLHTPILAASFLICVGVAIAGLQYREQPATTPFVVLLAGCAFYAGTTALEYTVTGLEASLFLWQLQYLGWVVIPPAMLVFVLRYSGRDELVTAPLLAALSIVPTVTLSLALTPLAPELVVENVQMVGGDGAVFLGYDVGPWYVVDRLYSLAVILFGFGLLIRTYLQTTAGQRAQVGALVAGLAPYVTLVPLYYYIESGLFAFGVVYRPEPFLFAVSGVVFAWALVRYDVLAAVPVPFALLIETTPNGVLVLDRERRVAEHNQVACEYLELTEPIVGNRLRTLSDPAERVDAIVAEETDAELQIGSQVYAVSTTPLVGQRDVEYGSHVVIQDVTKRVEYDRLLERHNEQLETLNQMLRHDIRNDAMVAVGWSDVLDERIEETPLEEDVSPLLQHISEAVEHIADLTEIASELSQPLEEPGAGAERSIPLRQVLEREVEKAAKTYPQAEFELRDPPAVDVAADRALSSAVGNLLRNAVVHNDTEVPQIDISVETVDGCARVHVADNGPGVPDEMRARLFDRGIKGEESNGSGLGLHLVQTFVRWYGGSVEVTDNEPEGAVFTIELPLVE
ncbi:ATP-binding protein [Halobacteria archaeon AArc-dxtr1]|nr:ATP-binding protein [Halobacteria archaeon AArc-dxtr1]